MAARQYRNADRTVRALKRGHSLSLSLSLSLRARGGAAGQADDPAAAAVRSEHHDQDAYGGILEDPPWFSIAVTLLSIAY